jgi:hypothetical protein
LNILRLVRLSFILVAFVLYSGQGWADDWQQTGSVSVSTGYDTNPSLSPAYPGGTWFGLLSPGYSLTGNVGANEINTGLAYRIARYSNKTVSPDRDNPSIFLDWKRQSDADEFGISTNYHESSARIAEVNNIGPGFVDSNVYYRIISGSWKRTLSERSTLLAGSSYESVSYNGGTYVNYVTRTGDMMFKYDWNERSAPFVKLSYVDYLPANNDQLNRLAIAMLGWNWIVLDYLDGDLQAGESKVSDVPMDAQFEATLRYKGQRTEINVNASHLTALSGLSGFITADQVIGRWNYALSELDKSGIDLGWRKNHYVNAITNITASAWLQHDFNSIWYARTYYLHKISEQAGVGTAFSNVLGITLVYTSAGF